jgi:CubicO group peptidase (beta-lactamase class C family)
VKSDDPWRRLRLTICLLISLLPAGEPPAAGAGRGSAADSLGPAIASTLATMLDDGLTELGVPGAASGVVTGDQILWEAVYGVRAGPDSPPITLDTVFCVRSISKSVTALAVMAAVQDGLVDLDTPISSYLPEFTVHCRFDERPEDQITLRLMLAHRAGFTHDPPAGLDLEQAGYFERYIALIQDSWLKTPVGYKHYYSNYGYDLAAYILQVRAGKPFAEYAQEKILEPIGMTDSTFDLAAVALRADRAVGHLRDGTAVPLPLPEIGAAGLYATIRDMCRYARFQLNGGVVDGHRIIRADLMEKYHAIQFAHRDQRTGYCFGLWREVVSDTHCYYHEGGGRGFGSHLMIYPELGIASVILTNMEYHGLTSYRCRNVMNGPIVDARGPLPVAAARLDTMTPVDDGDARIAAIIGRYGDSPGVTVGFEDDTLGIRVSAEVFLPMTCYDDGGELVGMFASIEEARWLAPLGSKPGAMMLSNRRFDNHNSHYLDYNDSALDSPGADKPEWQRYVGDYDVIWEDHPTSTITIEIRNGYLYLRDAKCEELQPGLFVHYDGEILDLHSSPPTFARQEIRKR